MKRRVYLDHASATPTDPKVLKAMKPYMHAHFGNPGANHLEGRKAKEALEAARKEIAQIVRVKTDEIIFTSGATEANTLAIIGHVEALHRQGRAYEDMHVVTSAIEHSNVLKSVAALAHRGVQTTIVTPDEEGIISPEVLTKALTEQTVLVSIQYVNSEIGTIMPLRKIQRALSEYNPGIVFHTDAAQAPLFLPILMEQVGADLMALDGQKFGGPRGVGVLLRKRDVPLTPILFGGSQERGLRPGTENVFLAVGFARGLTLAQQLYKQRSEKIRALRDWTLQEIQAALPDAILNGSTKHKHRAANNINISLPDRDTEYLATLLDTKGFAVSTKSTCEGAEGNGSEVVRATTQDEARALTTLRITLGPDTTKKEMERFVRALTESVKFIDEHSI